MISYDEGHDYVLTRLHIALVHCMAWCLQDVLRHKHKNIDSGSEDNNDISLPLRYIKTRWRTYAYARFFLC